MIFASCSATVTTGAKKKLPKSVSYTSGSVVYFQGDTDDRIYILQSGRIMLKSRDIETGQDIQDLIQTGEFFGVKSALGHYPREEDATALTNAQVVAFSVPEFEQLASSNFRISMKMLKVFSNQLRRIHSKVSSMLNTLDEIEPEKGLFHSAEFYFKNKKFPHALYILNRYIELFPTGRYIDQVREYREKAEQFDGMKNAGAPTPAASGSGKTLSETGKIFFEGENHFANQRYDEAIESFQQVIDTCGDDPEYKLKAQYEMGRSIFGKGDFAATIRYMSQLVQANPKMPHVGEALFIIGKSYVGTGDKVKGQSFLKRAASVAGDDAGLQRKLKKELADLGA